MPEERGHSDLALSFAFVAGALVGAAVALLLAPKPGVETRAQLADWARRAQEKAREAAERLKERSGSGS